MWKNTFKSLYWSFLCGKLFGIIYVEAGYMHAMNQQIPLLVMYPT